MNLQGERLIAATPEATWAALNDPEVLKACISGCESLERTSDNEFLAVTALRIGPVNARFKGRLKIENVVPISSYTIAFDGQGGVAGFGKGSADVKLTPEAGATRLAYTAKAQIGGKLAQVGARLIDGAAAKITDDFFSAFEARLAPAAAPGAELPTAARAPAATGAGSRRTTWIIVAAVVVLVLVWLAVR